MKTLKIMLLVLGIALAGCKPSKYAQIGDGLFADIQTNKGDIIIKLHYDQTPVTVANFVALAEGKNPFVTDTLKGKPFYNGIIFHRVIKDFMIQGGDPTGTGSGSPGYRFKDEFKDSLKHDKPGILSMANSGPATNGSQFFITHVPTPHLDGRHTVFGEVVQGMETVDTIANVATQKLGPQRDRPEEDVVMNTVKIIRNGKAARNFDAVAVMTTYFESVDQREKALEKTKASLAAEFETQKATAETLASGLKILYLKKGDGKKPKTGQKVMVNYAGYFTDGNLFDSNIEAIETQYNKYNPAKKQKGMYTPFPMIYSQEARMIPGFREGLLLMKPGDKVRLFVPSSLGYGPEGRGNVIPPDTDLIFDIEIVGVSGD